ncbi:MAG: GNAT family N-acetyltransferase [Candidatus Epulonipiscioides saccharophilum]|nr:MAG: GNAT family N-acetyltransferase [Epulopiscium sp. AS2M-Bin001]
MINYKEFDSSLLFEIKAIYDDSGWSAYLQDNEKLKSAFDNSLYLFGAFDHDNLVAFIRCVGDGEHIILIQDLIVLSTYQKKGIGTYLLKHCWDKYQDVRLFTLLTDIHNETSNHFYQSMNMKKLEQANCVCYYR